MAGMSTGDRQSVLRTTKVRNTLKGDNSWIQRRKDPEEEEEEKPWVAEVRAGRLNGAFSDTPPETTPTQPEPQPKPSTDSPKAPSSGYLIRGVFTKTDTKPTSPRSTNGYVGTSGFNKKPSEGYKKIAPHTVRPSLESTAGETEPAISKEEQERRTEVASNTMKSSAARQRSYVLSAAKKYESPPEKPDSSDPPVISFVAKRVVISDDDEDSDPAAKLPAAPASPNPPAQPAPKQSEEMSVDGPALPVAPVRKKVPSATPEPTPRTKAEPAPKQSSNALDALSDTLMSSTPAPSVSKPVAEVTPPAPEAKKAPSTAPEPKPKTEPAPKPSATEPVTPAVPVAKEAPSTAPEPKPKAEPTPKPSVTEPVAPQKVPATTPEPQPKAEPNPKPSAAAPTAPAAPVTQKAPTAAPKPVPKISVTEPSAQVTPVAPVAAEKKAPAATPEAKKEPTPKPSVTEPVPAAPVEQKAPSTTPIPKAEPTPKPSVTEPVPAAPVAQKAPSTTPEPKPKTEPTLKSSVTEPVPAPSTTPEPKPKTEPAPKPSVTEPVPAAPAAQKTPSATPEPKPKTEPTPKTSVTEPVPAAPAPPTTPEPKPKTEPKPNASVTEPVPAAPAPQKAPSTTPEPKTEPPPKASVTAPTTPAAPAAQKAPPTTPEPKPKTEPTPKARVDPKPVEKTNGLNDDDLLGLTQSAPQKPVNPVPTTTDLLSGADSSLPKTEKTKKSLDLLADDIIPFDTNPDKLSTDKTTTKIETTQTVVQSKDPKSSRETVTITTTKTETVTQNSSLPQSQKTQESLDLLAFDVIPFDTKKDKLDADKTQSKVETTKTVTRPKEELLSSADPFDPIPIVSECTKSPVELFDPLLSDSPRENLPADALSSLAKDVIPIDTDFTSLSSDTSKEPSDSSVPGKKQRSSDNVSPWDRWTSPILNTTTENRDADLQPMETSYTPYTRRVDRSALEPKSLDTDLKKGIVYVKEYVNTPGLPTYNSSDLDYVTSTSSNYAYSSPSSTNMTACTYCGGLVGNDAKITIEHLNISCHPECFKCGICSKPMGDFLHSMFLHRGTVHCESCYANVL